MSKFALLSPSHHPPSLSTTSMMSWLLWPSLEHSHTPLMTLYALSPSWTSLTSNLSSNRSETWTRRATTSLLPPLRSLRPQLHPDPPKTRPHLAHHPTLLLPRARPLLGTLSAPNACSALALATLRRNASSKR